MTEGQEARRRGSTCVPSSTCCGRGRPYIPRSPPFSIPGAEIVPSSAGPAKRRFPLRWSGVGTAPVGIPQCHFYLWPSNKGIVGRFYPKARPATKLAPNHKGEFYPEPISPRENLHPGRLGKEEIGAEYTRMPAVLPPLLAAAGGREQGVKVLKVVADPLEARLIHHPNRPPSS